MADKDNLEEVKSPIIMKVDAPPEDNIPEPDDENSVNEKKVLNENNVSEKSQNCYIPKLVTSKIPVLAKPKLFGTASMSNPFTYLSMSNPAPKSSVILSSPKLNLGNNSTPKPLLRPSKLSQPTVADADNSAANKPFGATPLQPNPFAKVSSSPQNKPDETKPDIFPQQECSSTSNENNTTKVDPPKFVPLTVENNATSSNTTSSLSHTSSAAPSFVFGQNLHERVIGEAIDGNGIDSTSSKPSSSTACSNGTSSDSESLFGNAAANDKSYPTSTTESKSLSEAAREYEESRAQKRKYEEVAVITGEENEDNVMQIGCKLFAFDQTTRNWQERGRGNLRLNDILVDLSEADGEASSSSSAKITQSRLVVRSTGSLRVVLNTKIWAGMSVELASPKSIRLTAMDSEGVVKVFLVMANVKEIEKLHKLLKTRVDKEADRIKTLEDDSNESTEHAAKRIAIDATSSTDNI